MARIGLSGGSGKTPQAARATTGSIAGGGTATVVVTMPKEMADLNYTVLVDVEEATATDTLRIRKIVSRTTSSVSVMVGNQDTLNAKTGTVHLLALAD